MLFSLQVLCPLLRELDAVQLFPCLLSKGDDIFHSITVFPLELVDQIHPLFNFIQLCIIRLVALQPPDQVSRKVFCGVIKIQQLSCSSRKAAVQLGGTIDRIGSFPSRSTAPGASSPPESSA